MNKIRTLEELNNLVDNDFGWRKKELITLKQNVINSKLKTIELPIRSGITLLYAHWEGFVKSSSEMYLNYVANKKLKYNQLSYNFIALCLKRNLTKCQETNKSSIHTQVVNFLLENLSNTSDIPCEGIISSDSNLNSKILKEIMLTIGLQYSKFELKEKLLAHICNMCEVKG